MNEKQKRILTYIVQQILYGIAIILAILIIFIIGSKQKNNSARDYEYEHYCDSIYEANSDYYLDVLVESEEFQNYLDNHGIWWEN